MYHHFLACDDAFIKIRHKFVRLHGNTQPDFENVLPPEQDLLCMQVKLTESREGMHVEMCC